MGKKILLATDSYHFAPTANGICVEEIADELRKMGNEVHVLCFQHKKEKKDDRINGIRLHRIKMDWVNRLRFLYEKELKGFAQSLVKTLMVILNRLEAVAFIHWFPMRSPFFCHRYTKKVEKLQRQYKFDIIVASYSPFEAAYALAKMNPRLEVKKCLYTLDSLTNLKKRFFLSPEYQEKKGWKWEQKIYDKCDLILNLKCHEKHYNKERYNKYKRKMKIVDIPHMIPFDRTVKNSQSGQLHIMYAGSIRDDIMPYALKCIEEFMEDGKLIFDLYTRSPVVKYQNSINSNARSRFVMHGFVDRDTILRKEQQADILLTMGNSDSDFISSKIFECMATGKKVLHIYSYDRDSAKPYYDIYPNSCCLDINDSIIENKRKLIEFIHAPLVNVSFEELSNIYYMNTPEYTAKLIMNMEE